MTFDFLESNSPDFHEISFRVVRLQTDSSNTETLITNLNPDRFPLAALKALYARRWGIETSFRSLKYAVGLIHLHAKKPDLVLQEVFASFLFFNFSQAAAWAVDASQGTAKYKRHVNFSDAVFACCAFLRRSAIISFGIPWPSAVSSFAANLMTSLKALPFGRGPLFQRVTAEW